jgi:glutamine amidotransferase
MCRHLAYLGPTTGLDELLFRAPHALARQAQHPRLQLWGDDNPDGWGVAWYPAPGRPPSRHRTVTAIWDDAEFEKYAGEFRGSAFIAAARFASPGAQVVETGNAPFVDGRWSCSLNGMVDGFTEGVGDELRARLTAERQAGLEGDSDTEVIFALVLQHVHAGIPPQEAIATVIRTVLDATTARLNLLLGNGSAIYASRVGNSLFRNDHVIVSEPTDDAAGWQEIPDCTVTMLTAGRVTDTSL